MKKLKIVLMSLTLAISSSSLLIACKTPSNKESQDKRFDLETIASQSAIVSPFTTSELSVKQLIVEKLLYITSLNLVENEDFIFTKYTPMSESYNGSVIVNATSNNSKIKNSKEFVIQNSYFKSKN
ncbi:hypothetical protein [Spiroplasma tabanidicola]|uniref:Lipoprotein n=1 Tax=Spiroplasma tabanidicola TaxID=324079 RepID=A0A6I6C3P4_9MOLU|nr:hypothetical protein [Spiroplasma tabanidicola]QGS51417.1 hypothetical protein STABA_v1c00500 [Spiroplasma tabanidicola]